MILFLQDLEGKDFLMEPRFPPPQMPKEVSGCSMKWVWRRGLTQRHRQMSGSPAQPWTRTVYKQWQR